MYCTVIAVLDHRDAVFLGKGGRPGLIARSDGIYNDLGMALSRGDEGHRSE